MVEIEEVLLNDLKKVADEMSNFTVPENTGKLYISEETMNKVQSDIEDFEKFIDRIHDINQKIWRYSPVIYHLLKRLLQGIRLEYALDVDREHLLDEAKAVLYDVYIGDKQYGVNS